MRLLTPPGVAGLAIVRAGPEECDALWGCLQTRDGRPLSRSTRPEPRLALLVLDDEVIDEVLLVERTAGGCELHLHGAPALVAALRRRFTFDVDTSEQDAVERMLREALDEPQLDLAMEQRRCSLAVFLRRLDSMPSIERRAAIDAAIVRSRIAQAMVTPQRLVLAGEQNAGKSSLFNRLLFRERVLTGPVAGLTRDPVAEVTTLAGYPYELVDTAGEGPVTTAVDVEAIEVGRRMRDEALVLLVVDAGRGPTISDRQMAARGAIVVANKADLPGCPWPVDVPRALSLSCHRDDAATVRQSLGEVLLRARNLPKAGPVGGFAAIDAADLASLAALRSASGS